MSLIITKNFKRANALDSASDKEREYTRLYELAQKNITFHAAKGDSAKVAEWKRKADEYKRLAQEAENAAEARNTKDSAATDANFKKGDKVTVKTKWAGTRKGIVKEVINDPALKKAYVVEIEGAETYAYPAEIVSADACEDSSEPNNDADLRAADSCATDYDPNPQTRGKDIEVFSAQAIREESACENVLRKVIEDVEALVIKIHGPMSSWEEVIENSKMSPELPQAKKWSGTANRRYDYLLARERAISSILSELKRNHID